LAELTAAVAILAILAALVIPRLVQEQDGAERTACHQHQAELELQARLWRRNTGAYPVADLSDVAADPAYLPAGLPTCPVDGTAYTIDTTSGLVIGHTH
jgi:type II secretory pathway pseudopilin PulG